jgi:hypothetical protein
MEINPVIGDTGFVVALLNQADASHANVAAVYAPSPDSVTGGNQKPGFFKKPSF